MIALDASALLAFLLREPGHQRVAELLGEACISTVNFAEVLGRFARAGQDAALVAEKLLGAPIEIVDFTAAQAVIAAALAKAARPAGLSLGDRACLALAHDRRIRAVTADRAWSQLRIEIGIEVLR